MRCCVVAEDSRAVATGGQSWKRHAIDAVLVGIGTEVVLGATVPIFDGAGWVALLASVVILVACGFAATALVRLPLRWSYAVAVVLWVGSVLAGMAAEHGGPGGQFRLAVVGAYAVFVNGLSAGFFVVGAGLGRWVTRRGHLW
jgi:hypothetical protein